MEQELTRNIIERFDPMLRSPKVRVTGSKLPKRSIMEKGPVAVTYSSRRRPELKKMKRPRPKEEPQAALKTKSRPKAPVDQVLGPPPGSDAEEIKRIKEEALGVVQRVELILQLWMETEQEADAQASTEFVDGKPLGKYELDVLVGDDPISKEMRDKQGGRSDRLNVLSMLHSSLQQVGLQFLDWDVETSEHEAEQIPGIECETMMTEHRSTISQGLKFLAKTFDQALDSHTKTMTRMKEELQPQHLVEKVKKQKKELLQAKNDIWKLQAENEKALGMHATAKEVAHGTNARWMAERANWSKIVSEFERQIKFLEKLDAEKESKLREVDTLCREHNIDLKTLGKNSGSAGVVPPSFFEERSGEDLIGLVKRLQEITMCFDPNAEEKELIVSKFGVLRNTLSEALSNKANNAQEQLELMEMDMKRIQEELKRKDSEMRSHEAGHAKQLKELELANSRIDLLQKENEESKGILQQLQDQLKAAKEKEEEMFRSASKQNERDAMQEELKAALARLAIEEEKSKKAEADLEKLKGGYNELEIELQRNADAAKAKIDAAVAAAVAQAKKEVTEEMTRRLESAEGRGRSQASYEADGNLSEKMQEENKLLKQQLQDLQAKIDGIHSDTDAQVRRLSAEDREREAAVEASIAAAVKAAEEGWSKKYKVQEQEALQARQLVEELRMQLDQALKSKTLDDSQFFEARLRSANGRHEVRLRSAQGHRVQADKKAADAQANTEKTILELAASQEEIFSLKKELAELADMREHLTRNQEDFAKYKELIENQARLRSADGKRATAELQAALEAEKEAAAAAAASAQAEAAHIAAKSAAEVGDFGAKAASKIENLEKKLSEVASHQKRTETENLALNVQLKKLKKRMESQRKDFDSKLKSLTAMSERAQQMYEVERRKVAGGMQVIEEAEKLLDVIIADHKDLQCHLHDIDEEDEDEGAMTPSPGKLRPIADDVYSLLDKIEEMRTGVHAEKSNRARALLAQQQEERIKMMTKMMHGTKAKSARFFTMSRIASLIKYLRSYTRGNDGFVEGQWTREMLNSSISSHSSQPITPERVPVRSNPSTPFVANNERQSPKKSKVPTIDNSLSQNEVPLLQTRNEEEEGVPAASFNDHEINLERKGTNGNTNCIEGAMSTNEAKALYESGVVETDFSPALKKGPEANDDFSVTLSVSQDTKAVADEPVSALLEEIEADSKFAELEASAQVNDEPSKRNVSLVKKTESVSTEEEIIPSKNLSHVSDSAALEATNSHGDTQLPTPVDSSTSVQISNVAAKKVTATSDLPESSLDRTSSNLAVATVPAEKATATLDLPESSLSGTSSNSAVATVPNKKVSATLDLPESSLGGTSSNSAVSIPSNTEISGHTTVPHTAIDNSIVDNSKFIEETEGTLPDEYEIHPVSQPLILEIPKSPDASNSDISYAPTDTPQSTIDTATPSQSSNSHIKHISFNETEQFGVYDGDRTAHDVAMTASMRQRFEPLGEINFQKRLVNILGFSNIFEPDEDDIDNLPLSSKLEAMRIVNIEGGAKTAPKLYSGLKKSISYCDAVELTEQFVEFTLERKNILNDPNGYLSRELEVVDGILNITKKALHKSTTVAIQSLNNATNKDREQLLKDLDEDGDGFLDEDDHFDKEAAKKKLEIFAIRSDLLSKAVEASGGWKSVVFMPDGSLDTELNLSIWGKDEQIEILQATKNYFMSKAEMATANTRKRKRRGAIMHAAMKNVPAQGTEAPVDPVKMVGLANHIEEATRMVFECESVIVNVENGIKKNFDATSSVAPLPSGSIADKVVHVELQSANLVGVTTRLKATLEESQKKGSDSQAMLDAEISRLKNELATAEGESNRLRIQLRDVNDSMTELREAVDSYSSSEDALKQKLNEWKEAEEQLAEEVAGLNFEKLRRAKEITSLGTELKSGVDKRTAMALHFRQDKMFDNLEVMDERLQGLNKIRGENLDRIIEAVQFVRHVSQVTINGKSYRSIGAWAELRSSHLQAIADAAQRNKLTEGLLASRPSCSVRDLIDSPRVSKSAMSRRHRTPATPVRPPPEIKHAEHLENEPKSAAPQTEIHSGTIAFLRTDKLLAQRPRSPEDIVAFVHAKDVDRARDSSLLALANGYAEKISTDSRTLIVDSRRSPVAKLFDALSSPATSPGTIKRDNSSQSLSPRSFSGWGRAAADGEKKRHSELRPIKNKAADKSYAKKLAEEILPPKEPPDLDEQSIEGMCDFSTGGGSSVSTMSTVSSFNSIQGFPGRSREPTKQKVALDFTVGGIEVAKEVAEPHGPPAFRPKKFHLG